MLYCFKLSLFGQSDAEYEVPVRILIGGKSILVGHEAALQRRCFLAHFYTQALRLITEVGDVIGAFKI